MPGFEEVAAAIGVTDVAIRGIISLYDFIQDLKDMPAEVARMKDECLALTQCLQSVPTEDPRVSSAMEKIGVNNAVNQCNKACEKLLNDFHKWTKSGNEALSSRIRVRRHKAKIEKVTAQISVSKSTITLGLSITSMSLQIEANTAMSEEEKAELLRPLNDEIGRLKVETQRERQRATDLQQQLERLALDDDEDSDDVEFAQTEVKSRIDAYDQLLTSCAVASMQTQALQANVQIGNVTADDYSEATVGMPANVVGKVRQLIIGNVSSTNHSKTRVGIFES